MKRTEARGNINLLVASLIGDKISIREEDTIRLVLEFLSKRELCLSQISLERESGINNCSFGDDLIFLRQLIVDGQWDDALQFVQPLEYFDSFPVDQFKFIIYKHKYIELLCIRSESSEVTGSGARFQTEIAIQDIIDCLKHLEKYASHPEDYSALNALLTVPDLSKEEGLQNWNPSQWRLRCFQQVLPLVRVFLDVPEMNSHMSQASLSTTASSSTTNRKQFDISTNDRLMKLIFKGLMYEVALRMIQEKLQRTSGSPGNGSDIDVFNGCDFKFNLTGFLQQLSTELIQEYFVTGSVPEVVLNVEKHSKPDLLASWSEMILSAPIKPKVFPHNAVPFTRIKPTDLMSKSLSASLMAQNSGQNLMAMSVTDIGQFSRSTLAASGFRLEHKDDDNAHDSDGLEADSKPIANVMTASMDRLFQGTDVFSASTYLPTIVETNTPSTPDRVFDATDTVSAFQMDRQEQPAVACQRQGQFNNKDSSQVEHCNKSTNLKHNTPQQINNNNKNEIISDAQNNNTNNNNNTHGQREKNEQILTETRELKESETNNEPKDLNESYIDVWKKNKSSNVPKNSSKLRKVDSFRTNNKNNFQNPSSRPKSWIDDSRSATMEHDPDSDYDSSFIPNVIQTSVSEFPSLVSSPSSSSSRVIVNSDNNKIKVPIKSTSTILSVNHGPGKTPLPTSGAGRPPSSRPSTSASNQTRIFSSSTSIPDSRSQSRISTSHQKMRPSLTDNNNNVSPVRPGAVPETVGTFNLLDDEQGVVKFVSTARITDNGIIRAVDWHPSGQYFAVGSNSKLLRVFRNTQNNQDDNNNETSDSVDYTPEMIYRRPSYHLGSIYCLSWNKLGTLLATGSNDKIIKLIGFNSDTGAFQDCECPIKGHDGTIRDVCFMDDLTNGSSILLSGGAGNCRIHVTDCETATNFMSFSGHSRPIHSLYTWGGAALVSGSEDRTIRMWDLRSRDCYNMISCPTISGHSCGSVNSVAVDPSGRLLVSGHEDSTCMLYDIRAGRVIQTFNPHSADIRTIRFSNKAYYLLTGGGDNRLVLSNLQGDLTQPIQSVEIAHHDDKVISARWHPTEFSFISASADKTTSLWTLQDHS